MDLFEATLSSSTSRPCTTRMVFHLFRSPFEPFRDFFYVARLGSLVATLVEEGCTTGIGVEVVNNSKIGISEDVAEIYGVLVLVPKVAACSRLDLIARIRAIMSTANSKGK